MRINYVECGGVAGLDDYAVALARYKAGDVPEEQWAGWLKDETFASWVGWRK